MKKILILIIILSLISFIFFFINILYINKQNIYSSSDIITSSYDDVDKYFKPVNEKIDYCEIDYNDVKVYKEIKIEVDNQYDTLSIVDYLIGVLAAEVSPSWSCEALRTQSIVSRTYAYKKLETSDFLYTDSRHQSYLTVEEQKILYGTNFEYYTSKLRSAIISTSNTVITYSNSLIDALYFSTAGGYTLFSEDIWSTKYNYIRSVPSPWDQDSDNFFSINIFSLSEIEKIFDGCNIISVPYRKENGIATNINLCSDKVSANYIRNKLQLKSPLFIINKKYDRYIFEVYGYGHQVGLSQEGTKQLAKLGYNQEQIIKYYYYNVSLRNYNDIF